MDTFDAVKEAIWWQQPRPTSARQQSQAREAAEAAVSTPCGGPGRAGSHPVLARGLGCLAQAEGDGASGLSELEALQSQLAQRMASAAEDAVSPEGRIAWCPPAQAAPASAATPPCPWAAPGQAPAAVAGAPPAAAPSTGTPPVVAQPWQPQACCSPTRGAAAGLAQDVPLAAQLAEASRSAQVARLLAQREPVVAPALPGATTGGVHVHLAAPEPDPAPLEAPRSEWPTTVRRRCCAAVAPTEGSTAARFAEIAEAGLEPFPGGGCGGAAAVPPLPGAAAGGARASESPSSREPRAARLEARGDDDDRAAGRRWGAGSRGCSRASALRQAGRHLGEPCPPRAPRLSAGRGRRRVLPDRRWRAAGEHREAPPGAHRDGVPLPRALLRGAPGLRAQPQPRGSVGAIARARIRRDQCTT
ncbi:unnamed protein product [Prorocentrum cordatum]|uniref:Glutamine synthetase n=1 Tax=Prorocentrum cordatum TaxID=2364126 RepID=A0ABN9U809_9DINO|nr:unnamed protein product [Polarella glacialis]